ncbi:MAG TPA: tetratricopeptide repeat protein [bacterium]
MKRRWIVDGALIAVIALAVRLIYVLQLSKTPFFEHPVVDAQYHDAWAREILRLGIGHEGVFFRAPLYPYFLALVYAMTNGSFLWARLFQAFLGSLTAVLTYGLGREITGQRRVGLVAGFGAALYGMMVYFDGELRVETLFIPLLLASLLAYAKFRNRRRLGLLALTGLFLGLAAITRPSALVILFICIADLLLADHQLKTLSSWKKRPANILLLLGCCSMPILPVAYHNSHTGGDAVLIAASGGINFYIGNNPQADGLHSIMPGFGATWDVPEVSLPAYQAAGRTLKLSEINHHYSRLAWQYIWQNPLAAGGLFVKKIFAFWNRLEISNNRDLYFFKYETRIMPHLRLFSFWIVGPLGLLGLWIGWRRRLLPGWFLGIIPVYMLSVAAFFVTARFRAPMIPLLLICAAMALFQLIERRIKILDHQRLIDFITLLLPFLFVNSNPWSLRTENPAHAYFCLGNAYLDAEKLEQARDAFQSARAADSLYPRAHLNLGVIAYRSGDSAKAEAEYQRELVLYPREFRALNNLGVLRYNAGRSVEAADYYQRALDMAPYFSDARINVAQCRFKQGMEEAEKGHLESAEIYFREAIEGEDDNALYHYNYALTLGKMGRAEEARTHLEATLKLKPDLEEARRLLRDLQEILARRSQTTP